MIELLRKYALMRTRRVRLLGLAISLSAFPAFAWAQSLPPSARSCTAETDPGRRLACYDKEAARLPAPSSPPATKREPATDCCAKSPSGDVRRDSNSSVAGASAGDDRSRPSEEQRATKQDGAEQEPRHPSARVLSVEGSQDEMVLHLDNGQTWEQVQEASADLHLRAGDTVKIDRQLGDYWLSGRYGVAMKVRRKK
jgi:hypothetical protein